MTTYTPEQITEALREIGVGHITKKDIDSIANSLGLTLEPETPAPGVYLLPSGGVLIANRKATVIFNPESGEYTTGLVEHCRTDNLTPARVVPAAPVELTEDEVGREFDAMNERDGYLARWSNYTDEARSQYTRIWNAAVSEHISPSKEYTK